MFDNVKENKEIKMKGNVELNKVWSIWFIFSIHLVKGNVSFENFKVKLFPDCIHLIFHSFLFPQHAKYRTVKCNKQRQYVE